MNWDEIEQRLYQASVDTLRHFSRDHLGESFYGFAFACNADYGEVMLCLNTAEGLRATIEKYHATDTPEEIDRHIKWNPGDWIYANINADEPYAEAWDAAWSDTQLALQDATFEDGGEEVAEIFVESVCRVLIAMENNDEFHWIQRDPDFATFVTDHDESLEDAWERLKIVRRHTKLSD